MHIGYLDESGNDGTYITRSPYFIYSLLYVDENEWKSCFEQLMNFKRELKSLYNFPVKIEIHTRDLLRNKKPYNDFDLSVSDRAEIISKFCKVTGSLKVKMVNVAIDKTKYLKRSNTYEILDTALTFTIQRIENDLKRRNDKYLLITDRGRVDKMRKVSRRIAKINPIPSSLRRGEVRKGMEITNQIEDILSKDSQDSFFIQICDLVSFIINLYSLHNNYPDFISKRYKYYFENGFIGAWMEVLSTVFNKKASRDDPYGIKYYPK